LVKPLIIRYGTHFLHEDNVEAKQNRLVKEKIKKLSNCSLGKKLGVDKGTSINDMPLTGYNLYLPFFKDPSEGELMYPLSDYVNAHTSGTMGKPKNYLLPKTGFIENIKKTALGILLLCTYDEGEFTYDIGDVLYANYPGGSFFSALMVDSFKNRESSFLKVIPDNSESMTFQEKVDFFIDNYEKIDISGMMVTTFLDEIYPRLKEPLSLKGFLTSDIAAGPLKEEIKEKSGSYPSTIYASTETMVASLPSVEYPGGFFFDWRVIYPEFIPEDNQVNSDIRWIVDTPDTLSMFDVEEGKRYQLIATPYYNDFTRYVMPDILECVAKSDDLLTIEIPIFKYYSRADNLLVIHNFTRISEEELLMIMKNSDIPFTEFTVRRELEGSKEYLSVYMELRRDMSEEEIYTAMNEALISHDDDWRDLNECINYTPLKLKILPEGTFNNFLDSVDMHRVNRISMKEKHFNKLLDSCAANQ